MHKEIKKIKKYKISIITVCFNSEKTIKKTLKSIQNQKYNKIEHVIIDGKSNDKTISIVKKFQHIKKIISEKDHGIYDAMNKGLKIASGDIVGFLNSDDFYASSNVLNLVNKTFNQDPKLEACYADLVYIHPNDAYKVLRYWKSNKFVKGSFSKGWSPPHPTFFVRSSIYKKFGNFNLNYKIASDIDLMMRFIEVKKIKTHYISKVLVKMRSGGVSNRSLKNVLKLNQEILISLNENNLPYNFLLYITNKIVIKLKQYFNIYAR